LAERFRFGEFEFDAGSGKLRRLDGSGAQQLPPQPAELLHLLAAGLGAVVTRDEIRQRLWPEIHVEFDASLHFCVRQIRTALGDSGTEPRYVQNVPRRGYRLIPEVSRVEQAGAPVLPRAAASRRWVLVSIVLLVASLIAGGYRYTQSARDEPRMIRIGIMPFQAPIAEWILQDLSAIGGASVGLVGPTTTAAYAGSDANLRRLANDYRLDFIVNGRVLGQAGAPRMLAELIRVSDGVHVWVRPYDDLTDGRRVGREISQDVARVLELPE
jgi:DNA-binding winged helix-turn-helix (wHTH) protein/TolB-like protein